MSASSSASEPARRVVSDFVCTACGCTCDDLRLTVEGRRITTVQPPCPLAERFLLQDIQPPPAACLIDGQPADLDAALQRAAEILQRASAPLVMGLERATVEAQRFAVEIADRLGALIDPTDEFGRSRSHIAVQTAGAVTATLGEVASRSDLIVYWNVDPMTTHPRRLERFANRRRAGGEASLRRVITVSPTRSATSQAAHEHLDLGPDGDVAALAALRAIIKGLQLDAAQMQAQTGAALEQWSYLAQRLKMARYAAIFFEPLAGNGGGPDALSQGITDLVRELHRHTRAVALRLGAAWNTVGAAQVLTWQTGFPAAVNFAAGYPRYLPGEASAPVLLERGEIDAALIIGADPAAHLPDPAKAHLAGAPCVVIDDHMTATAKNAAVAIFTARFGIESTGSVYRSDGVSLPLRAAIEPRLPQAETVLEQLARQLYVATLSLGMHVS